MENKITAVVKYPHKKPKTVEIDNTLEALQDIVGGLITSADLPDIFDVWGFCNDEGLLIGLEPNIFRPEYGDGIVGPIVFVGGGDDGESISLTSEQIKKVSTYLEENSVKDFQEFCHHINTGFENYKPKKQTCMRGCLCESLLIATCWRC